MSQGDMVVDNDTGAATRADINVQFGALVSSNSGATAPSTTFAYQTWADTANDLMKIRNAANSAWITLYTLSDPSATATQEGLIELATLAELNTGTDATRAVTPDILAGSYAGTKIVSLTAFSPTADTATGDDKVHFHIPAALNGMDLVSVHAEVITAGTTNTTDIQVRNDTQAADMLSTVITIDSGETGSDTAATPAVIDTANDDVATNDLIAIDVDAISTTPAKGLVVTLEFRLP